MTAPIRQPSGTGYVPSDPVFLRRIGRAMILFVAAACALAAFLPAPLQEPADLGKAPNPARSAWFLLWIQELVSHSRHLIHLAALLALLVLALPFTRWGRRDDAAERSRRAVAAVGIAIFSAIVALTVVAYFFRGKNWALSAPF